MGSDVKNPFVEQGNRVEEMLTAALRVAGDRSSGKEASEVLAEYAVPAMEAALAFVKIGGKLATQAVQDAYLEAIREGIKLGFDSTHEVTSKLWEEINGAWAGLGGLAPDKLREALRAFATGGA